jgi:phosphatidylethanolamine-binding protein (PEBP) family uncharacterized protein
MKIKVNGYILNSNDIYSSSIFSTLDIKSDKMKPNKLYTIIIYDNDAPNPSFIHLLIINTNNTILKYYPPSPPKGQTHTYHIKIFEQSKQIEMNIKERSSFNINKLNNSYLTLIDHFSFKVKS